MNEKKIILVMSVGLTTLAVAPSAAATTWFVDVTTCPGVGSGTAQDPFCKIQSGIDAASDGDAVIVAPGRYFENIHMMGKNITLRNNDPANPVVVAATIIDGSQPVNPDAASTVTFAGTEGTACLIDGLTITGGSGTLIFFPGGGFYPVGGGVLGNGCIAELRRCNVVGNTINGGSQGGGVYDLDGTIAFCSISNNALVGSGNLTYGAGLANCDGPISDSIINGNLSSWPGCCSGRAAGLYRCSGAITRCNITNNLARAEGGAMTECHGPISDCHFAGNFSERGAVLHDCDGAVSNCTFVQNESNDSRGIIYLSDGPKTNCAFTQNIGPIINGSTGVIANCSFINNVPYGSYALISGEGTPGLQILNCLFENNLSPTIQGNIEEIADSTFTGNGGFYTLIDLSGPVATIFRSVFTNHTTGGTMIATQGTNLTVRECTFNENMPVLNGSPVLYVFGGDLLLDRVFFANNHSWISTVVAWNSNARVQDSRFVGNIAGDQCGGFGGAIHVVSGTATIVNSLFSGNRALLRTELPDNCGGPAEAVGGGAVYANFGASLSIVGSTFVGNESEEIGGAIFISDGASLVTNSVFSANVDSSTGGASANIFVASGVTTVNQSNLQGGWTGDGQGNIDADALFVDPDGPDDIVGTEDDDLRLSAGSPCIDAGDNNTAMLVGLNTDISGLPRFIDEPSVPDTGVGTAPIVDMGAYEYAASLLMPPGQPASPHDRRKNRYVSFAPQSGPVTAAYRLSKMTAPGGECWVDAPDATGNAHCVAEPVYRLWSEPVVHVGDCEVMPVVDYEIAASVDAFAFTTPLPVSTIAQPSFNNKLWGDVAGLNNGMEWTPPNQFTNVQDIVAVLAYISNAVIKSTFQMVNLQAVSSADPCLNALVNTADVLIVVKAVAGDAYPFTTNPASCPVCP